jgi:hypothetical protein
MTADEAASHLDEAVVAGRAHRAGGAGVILRSSVIPGLESLKTEVGKRALRSGAMVGTGLTMQESEDERLQATGKEIVAWGILSALYPTLKASGIKGGTAMRDALAKSPTGQKVLNAISYDLTMDPRVRDLADEYERMIAKGQARAAEMRASAKNLTPEEDRRISDLIENEAFEPVSGKDTPLVIALAQRMGDEFTEMGRLKVQEGLLTPQTVEAFDQRYMKRMYGQHLAEGVTNEAPLSGGRKVRIRGEVQRKNLPDEVRNALGEIREGSFRTGSAIETSYRDIAAAKMFNDLTSVPGAIHPESMEATKAFRGARAELHAAVKAKAPAEDIKLLQRQMENAAAAHRKIGEDFLKAHDGYVRMPDTPGMGTLRGVVVRKDVADYLDMLPALQQNGGYLRGLRWWKMSHTVLNPGTHVGNMASNVAMAHMGGLPIHKQGPALAQALKDWNAYGPRVKYLAEHGTLERGLPTFGDARIAGTPEDRLRALFETTRPETRAALTRSGITPKGGLRKTAEAALHGAEAAYGKEDGVFRVALFNELVDNKGMAWDEAAKFVQRQFVDYGTRSPILRTISRYASPFILFPAKALPHITDQVIQYPERWMTLMALWGGLDQYSRHQVGPLDFTDLELERREKGYLLPSVIQLPWGDNEEGRKAYLDLTRWTPFSAASGPTAPGSLVHGLSAGIPQVFQPSGPILDIGARMSGTDPFTGERMLNDAMSDPQKWGAAGKAALQIAAPTALGYHVPKIREDILNADYHAAMIDALALLGMKPRVVTSGLEANSAEYEYDRDLLWLRQQYRKKMKAAEQASPERQDEIAKEYEDGLDRANDRYERKLGIEQQAGQQAKRLDQGKQGVQYKPLD